MTSRFEPLATRVWPAAEVETVGGWQLGFTSGCTKRANSVQTFGAEPGELLPRIEACEARYRSRALPPIFKLTDASPATLDALLDARGYRVVDPTSVQVREDASPVAADARVSLRRDPDASWLRGCMELNRVPPSLQRALSGIFERARAACDDTAFASIEGGERTLAQGVAVLDGGAACLCEIATREAARRNGLASAIVASLCAWAHDRGATPWLQVVASNDGARALYGRFGFREAYRYWYRLGG